MTRNMHKQALQLIHVVQRMHHTRDVVDGSKARMCGRSPDFSATSSVFLALPFLAGAFLAGAFLAVVFLAVVFLACNEFK